MKTSTTVTIDIAAEHDLLVRRSAALRLFSFAPSAADAGTVSRPVSVTDENLNLLRPLWADALRETADAVAPWLESFAVDSDSAVFRFRRPVAAECFRNIASRHVQARMSAVLAEARGLDSLIRRYAVDRAEARASLLHLMAASE